LAYKFLLCGKGRRNSKNQKTLYGMSVISRVDHRYGKTILAEVALVRLTRLGIATQTLAWIPGYVDNGEYDYG
jgi:hypothetical protein